MTSLGDMLTDKNLPETCEKLNVMFELVGKTFGVFMKRERCFSTAFFICAIYPFFLNLIFDRSKRIVFADFVWKYLIAHSQLLRNITKIKHLVY